MTPLRTKIYDPPLQRINVPTYDLHAPVCTYVWLCLCKTSRPRAGYAPHIFVNIDFKTQSLPRNVALLRNFIFLYAELHATFKHAKYHFEDLETP